jgi:hypothetical protein
MDLLSSKPIAPRPDYGNGNQILNSTLLVNFIGKNSEHKRTIESTYYHFKQLSLHYRLELSPRPQPDTNRPWPGKFHALAPLCH